MPDHISSHQELTNAYLDVNGIPYVLADYMDRRRLKVVDGTWIKSEVHVDQNEAMRAVVHLSVDDIGKCASDGLPAIVGNRSKKDKLVKLIQDQSDVLDHQLGIIRNGLIMRVNYQLENATTHQVIRTMTEDLRIRDREYFLYLNPRDVDDNAIITGFQDTLVSTINEFTHGRDRMSFRITKVQMFYEATCPDRHVHNVCYEGGPLDTCYGAGSEYYHHCHAQSHQCIDDNGQYHYTGPNEELYPSGWNMVNYFYHFANEGRDLKLHMNEIYDRYTHTTLVPCGTVNVNRVFLINPGHKIVFKFSVWKNDLTSISDSSKIARALAAPMLIGYIDEGCDHHTFHHYKYHHRPKPFPDGERPDIPPILAHPDHPIDPAQDAIIEMLRRTREVNSQQSAAINEIVKTLHAMQNRIDHMTVTNPANDPDDPATIPMNCKACVDGVHFESLQDAINAVEAKKVAGDILLIADVEEYVMVHGNVTIDLNWHNITAPHRIDDNTYNHTIAVDGGNLVIKGAGDITNDTQEGACIINLGADDDWLPDRVPAAGMGAGSVTIRGGHIYRTSNSTEIHGPVLVNHGAVMTINDGAKVDTSNDGDDVIVNGRTDGVGSPMLTINGGKISGGVYTLKNMGTGLMVVNSGVATMGTRWVENAESGPQGPQGVLSNTDTARVLVKGGSMVGDINNQNTNAKSIQVTGGAFSTDISAYLAEGYVQNVSGVVHQETE